MKSGILLRVSLRAALAWCVLSIAGFIFVRPIVSTMIPLMETMIDHMQSDYMARLALIEVQGNTELTMSCTATRKLFLPGGRIVPFLGTVSCAYMDAVHALVPIVIFLVAVVSWPTVDSRDARRRFLAALFVMPCIVALSAPTVLVGLESMGRNPDLFTPTSGNIAAFFQPFAFLEMGGRWVLPLVAAVACVRFAERRTIVADESQ
jgi:hypothetical protein